MFTGTHRQIFEPTPLYTNGNGAIFTSVGHTNEKMLVFVTLFINYLLHSGWLLVFVGLTGNSYFLMG